MTQVSAHHKHFLSAKVEHFTESVIREMTRQAMQYGAINLAQGFPDFSAPAEIKRAAQEAVAADVEFAAYLVKEIGIACVPWSSFCKHPKDGSQQAGFAPRKKSETLDEAARRLEKLARK